MKRTLIAALTLVAIAACPALGWDAAFPHQGAASRAATAFPIDAMLVGDKVLQVTGSRQLTLRSDGKVVEVHISPNGRYVVYTISDNRGEANLYECRLVNVSTGKTATIMSRIPPDQLRKPDSKAWTLDSSAGIAWSPDSAMFAFKASHVAWETGKVKERQYIVVFSASGAFKRSLPLHTAREEGDNIQVAEKLLFTPDSRRILANLLVPDLSVSDNKIHPLRTTLRLIDVASGSSRDVSSSELAPQNPNDSFVIWSYPPHVIGWAQNALLYTKWENEVGELRRLSLDNGSDEIVLNNIMTGEVWSSDGQFSTITQLGIAIRSLQSKAASALVTNHDALFAAWAPNNRMILYTKEESIADAVNKRERTFRSLWLSTIDTAKPESLCVALDAEQLPSCSRDCSKIAYICQGQLNVAELTLREPTLGEKLEAGLPLDEDELKVTLLTNGKQIAMGVIMYAADHDDMLPPADSIQSALGDYAKGDLFARPDTKANVYSHANPGVAKLTDIDRPAETVIGELDAGYNWKILIYADTHVETKAKQ